MPSSSSKKLPVAVEPGESLARFLTQSNHYHLPTNSVKPKAFEPPPDLRLSVFRIDDLGDEDAWQIGQVEVIGRIAQPRTLYGLADIKAQAVQSVGLSIDPDSNPPRHASIVGWPREKSQQKLMAQELAASARLVLRA